jgi:4-diphosphocytidyl-2-C-methyl-D-erythritol kinase
MNASILGAPAPAKLNLFLHVTGRRADGYHTLQTVFTFIDYGDTLDFVATEDGRITQRSPLVGIPPEEDLCLKAALALQRASGCKQGVVIGLHKRIPMGGGLGGGSSDAATTLLILNKLWGLFWSRQALLALAVTLGADVPVFVAGNAAFAEGIGEVLTPLVLPTPWYLVVDPQISVSTREIFEAPDLTRGSIPVKMCDFSMEFGRNDLQPVVSRRYPQVARLLDALNQMGAAKMTGSGACCFVPFEQESDALAALRQIPPDCKGFIARGINHHPLRD